MRVPNFKKTPTSLLGTVIHFILFLLHLYFFFKNKTWDELNIDLKGVVLVYTHHGEKLGNNNTLIFYQFYIDFYNYFYFYFYIHFTY